MSKESQRSGYEIQTAGDAPAVAAVDAAAVYDPKDGRVVHLHHVVRFEGVEPSSPKALGERAIDAASQMGLEAKDLAVLHVPDFKPSGLMYRVDLKQLRLVGEQPRVPQDDG